MAVGKMLSQMNPLAQGDFKAMLAEFRSVEIQASDSRSKSGTTNDQEGESNRSVFSDVEE